jgi:hypothetical protein
MANKSNITDFDGMTNFFLCVCLCVCFFFSLFYFAWSKTYKFTWMILLHLCIYTTHKHNASAVILNNKAVAKDMSSWIVWN